MATITKGKTFTNGELVTPATIHQLVDAATISGIVNADIAASAAIVDTKLAQISTANKVAQSAVTNLTTDLAGKAASSHTHDDRYYTETEIDNKLSGLPVSGHTHTIANVTNLQTTLDGKQASGSYAPATGIAQSAVTNLTTDLAGKAPTSHTHTIANVTNLQTTLDGKQASGSYAPSTGIAPSAITGTAVITTDSRLSDARTPTTHTHSASDITSGNFANARTTATNANTASAIVARDSFGDFVANRITSSQTIPKAGSLRFNDTYGAEVEITGDSVDDKLFIKAGGSTIIEIDNTSGFPIFKINTGISNAFRVSIGGSSPPACAKLEIASTTQGFLLPRMTTSQRNAISAVAGLMIYNTTTERVEVFGGINYPQFWYTL